MLNMEIMSGEKWSQCEDDFVLQNAETMPVEVMAAKLKRSVEAVLERIDKITIDKRTYQPWCMADDVLLIKEGQNARQMKRKPRWMDQAQQMGKTIDAVKSRVRTLRRMGVEF